MRDYFVEAIEDSGLNIVHSASTSAKKNLVEVTSDVAELNKARADSFCSVVMKLIYVAIRARMDLLLAVSFLSTRISKSTVEDETN
jgi:hypothetical protein